MQWWAVQNLRSAGGHWYTLRESRWIRRESIQVIIFQRARRHLRLGIPTPQEPVKTNVHIVKNYLLCYYVWPPKLRQVSTLIFVGYQMLCTVMYLSVSKVGHWRCSVPSSPLEMVVDYYVHDYEFGEPPRVTSLQNTVPLPTFVDFGEDLHFVGDQRGYESVVYHVAKQFLKTNNNGSIVDPRLLLNKVFVLIWYQPCSYLRVFHISGHKTYNLYKSFHFQSNPFIHKAIYLDYKYSCNTSNKKINI